MKARKLFVDLGCKVKRDDNIFVIYIYKILKTDIQIDFIFSVKEKTVDIVTNIGKEPLNYIRLTKPFINAIYQQLFELENRREYL